MAAPRKRLTSGTKIATINFLPGNQKKKKNKNLDDKNFTKECG
jgi:hypothetical protein